VFGWSVGCCCGLHPAAGLRLCNQAVRLEGLEQPAPTATAHENVTHENSSRAVQLGGRKKQPATAQLLLDVAGAATSSRKQPPMHQQNTVHRSQWNESECYLIYSESECSPQWMEGAECN